MDPRVNPRIKSGDADDGEVARQAPTGPRALSSTSPDAKRSGLEAALQRWVSGSGCARPGNVAGAPISPQRHGDEGRHPR